MITRRSFLAAGGSASAIVAFPFKTFAKKPVAQEFVPPWHAGKIVGICPCCGSEDIELEESHMIPRHYEHVFGCKSCKAEFALQATITVSKWPGIE